MSSAPPPLTGVLETVLYYMQGEDEVERFYRDVLGMRPIGRMPGRFLFFRAGQSVFLLFNAEASAPVRPSSPDEVNVPPPHGAQGSVHVCFQAPPGEYERWKEHLAAQGVEVLSELRWQRGRSFYFHDPAGNLLEIADADIWPE